MSSKIITIIGARPQFIKAATVSRAIVATRGLQEVIVHTGQHFEDSMSDVFFDELKIPRPSYNLGINSLNHGAMTGRMLEGIEAVLLEEKPDHVLVYGDTNSTLAGALAARKLGINLAHVEAGLRSFNMQMPEEVNRILTDRISDVLFCPTRTARENLLSESADQYGHRIIMSGDVMLDAVESFRQYQKCPKSVLDQAGFIVCTIHRAENTHDPLILQQIISALNEISSQTDIVFPVHPRTRKVIEDSGMDVAFKMIDPVSYLEMAYLLSHCSMVMTDSGGLQKEAYFHEKFCLTLRDETEWVELVDVGANVLVGSNRDRIIRQYEACMSKSVSLDTSLYGDGNASGKIAAVLEGQ